MAIKRVIFNLFEQLTLKDLNDIGIFGIEKTEEEIVNKLISGGDSVIVEGLAVTNPSGDTFRIGTGRAIFENGEYLINDNTSYDLLTGNGLYDNTNDFPADVPNDRYFIIQIRSTDVDSAGESRNFINSSGNTFSQQTIKLKTKGIESRIKVGTSSASPAKDSGWLKLAEVKKTLAGAYEIHRVDKFFSNLDNTGWTVEKQVTYKLRSLSDHRNNDVLDHPDESVTENKLATLARIGSKKLADLGDVDSTLSVLTGKAKNLLGVNDAGTEWVAIDPIDIAAGIATTVIDTQTDFNNIFGANGSPTKTIDITNRIIAIKGGSGQVNSEIFQLDHAVYFKGKNGAVITNGAVIQYTHGDATLGILDDSDIEVFDIENDIVRVRARDALKTNNHDGGHVGDTVSQVRGGGIALFDNQSYASDSHHEGEYFVDNSEVSQSETQDHVQKTVEHEYERSNTVFQTTTSTVDENNSASYVANGNVYGFMLDSSGNIILQELNISTKAVMDTRTVNSSDTFTSLKLSVDETNNRAVIMAIDSSGELKYFTSLTTTTWFSTSQPPSSIGDEDLLNNSVFEILAENNNLRIFKIDSTTGSEYAKIYKTSWDTTNNRYNIVDTSSPDYTSSTDNSSTDQMGLVKVGSDYYYSFYEDTSGTDGTVIIKETVDTDNNSTFTDLGTTDTGTRSKLVEGNMVGNTRKLYLVYGNGSGLHIKDVNLSNGNSISDKNLIVVASVPSLILVGGSTTAFPTDSNQICIYCQIGANRYFITTTNNFTHYSINQDTPSDDLISFSNIDNLYVPAITKASGNNYYVGAYSFLHRYKLHQNVLTGKLNTGSGNKLSVNPSSRLLINLNIDVNNQTGNVNVTNAFQLSNLINGIPGTRFNISNCSRLYGIDGNGKVGATSIQVVYDNDNNSRNIINDISGCFFDNIILKKGKLGGDKAFRECKNNTYKGKIDNNLIDFYGDIDE